MITEVLFIAETIIDGKIQVSAMLDGNEYRQNTFINASDWTDYTDYFDEMYPGDWQSNVGEIKADKKEAAKNHLNSLSNITWEDSFEWGRKCKKSDGTPF
jgi:hypothetical protein